MAKKEKKKQTDEVPETEAAAVETKADKATKGNPKTASRGVMWLVILLIIAGGAGYVYMKKQAVRPLKTPVVQADGIEKQKTETTPQLAQKISEEEAGQFQTMQTDMPPAAPIEQKTDAVIPQTPVQIQDIKPVVPTPEDQPVEEEVSIVAAEIVPPAPIAAISEGRTYLERSSERTARRAERRKAELVNILALRDDFILERNCFDSFNIVLANTKAKSIMDVAQRISPFCLSNEQIYHDLKRTFEAQKREAIRASYKEMDASWKGVVKSWGTAFVQTRDLKPSGQTPADILDRAHNALDKKDIEGTLELIATLPAVTRAQMVPYTEKAQGYVDAKKALDDLILSYTIGE